MVKRFVCSLLGVLVSLWVLAGAACAVTPAAGWSIESLALPSSFSESQDATCLSGTTLSLACDSYQVTVRNAGSAPTGAGPIVIADALPAGVTAHRISLFWSREGGDFGQFFCGTASVRCEFPVALGPDETLTMTVYVTVQAGAPGSLRNTASVSGGGIPGASTSVGNANGSGEPSFGLNVFGQLIAGIDGAPDTQAGAHPYELTTTIGFNSAFRGAPRFDPEGSHRITSVQDPRDVALDLPVGFVGSALAAPMCTLAQLTSSEHCPRATTVGSILTQPEDGGVYVNSPLYNIVPESGVAAEFGFFDVLHGTHVIYASVVPTAAGYVLRATSPEIPQLNLARIFVTLYGNPAEKDGSGSAPVALLTNPADCSAGPLTGAIHVDSWQDPGRIAADGTPDFSDPNWVSGSAESPPVTGCDQLRFHPSLGVQPETTAADSATGLSVDLKVPQSEDPNTLATPPLRDASVTLPAGLTLNPAAAAGLGACSLAQIDLGGAGAPSCPESSKIGTVEVATPALPGTLTGSVYLATQSENPFHSLLAGYIVIDDPTTGVVVKIPGDLTPDPTRGQITGVFDENPQLPFSELKLHFFGGARGELATPAGCGMYTTTSDLMPWSAPDSGPDATPSDSFPIDAGCVSGFAPGFTAGSENPQAGGYSPFKLSLSRNDGEQDLAGITVTLPPGLLGKIAGIPLCPDANANAGTCPEASLVGTDNAGAGAGPNPLFVPGKVYLTGPYKGGPYGLVIEDPAVAGPFNLGMVAVRQSLRIDPHTAQVTDVSDPFPTILQGIPLRVRRVDVTLDRPGFTFNPTSCAPMAIDGTATSTQGASAQVSSRFQAGGCRELPFKPTFTVSTQASTSKKNGASLDVKVTSGQGQANLRSVAVTLPKALPSRLTTIQQACPQATFAANPASCPAGSDIGIATARTPVLTNPVSGPVYLVSHGGAAFPDVVLILQGEGVKLELLGSIDIKKSITSSTFASIPDAPISSFELKLPEGPHSGLAAVLPAKAKGNLCGSSLVMPTTLTGQNGAVIKQSTKIAVTGCAKAKKKKHTKRTHGKAKRKGRKK